MAPPAYAPGDEPSAFAKAARSHWLKPKPKPKVKNDVLMRDVWEPLEREGFPYAALLELESLSILEKLVFDGLTSKTLFLLLLL
jgi:intron-binding protein aquarius